MYIISKRKDYYDGVVGSVGMDKTIVYERHVEEIEDSAKMPKEFQYKGFRWEGSNPFLNICHMDIDREKTSIYHDVDGFIVGFCGKLYMGWKFYYKEKEFNAEFNRHEDVVKTDIIYGLPEAVQYLKTDYWRGNFKDDLNYVGSYDPKEIFRDINAPVFVYDSYMGRPRRNDVFTINPNLKEWEFYKVVDAFTAFQEISMFIGGVLGTGEKEIIEVADKHKIAQHGFDEWSFRREPTKKRKR